MSTTIVFACKSNSCRSQMAEGWARAWIAAQRRGLAAPRPPGAPGDRRRRRAFLDGLLVASVALDGAAVAGGRRTATEAPPEAEALSSSPTSSLTTDFAGEAAAPPRAACVTCDGEENETCALPPRRQPPKPKAIQAMARDGVDIAQYHAKTVDELLPAIAENHRRHEPQDWTVGPQHWTDGILFAGLRRTLEAASLELGLAHAGVARGEDDDAGAADARPVDALVVLCACPESLKRPVAALARETLEWDVAAPTAAARGSEGDGAYVRVSRQIRRRVEAFLEGVLERAVAAGEGRGEDAGRAGARWRGPAPRALPVPA